MSTYNRAARIRNYIAMSMLASQMHPNYGPALRHTDPVAYADLVGSMNDRRAALSIACGVPVDLIDRNGYSPPGVIDRAKAAAEREAERLSVPAAPTPVMPSPSHNGPRRIVDVHLPAAGEEPSDDGLWTRSALLGGGE